MDILINPTNKCNFACKFCSASELPANTLSFQDTIDLLEPYKKNLKRLIFNGGDPLMMNPDYYLNLINWCEKEIANPVYLSLTTNLWDFYLNPNKWKEVLSHKRVGVTTSFQYGLDRRVITPTGAKPYTEEQFRKVLDMFKLIAGYYPTFIYVADYNNENDIIKALELAKEYKIRCRINKKVSVGRASNDYYPRYRIFEQYIKIIEAGYINYEMNCCTTLKHIFTNKKDYCCDHDRNCFNHMIVINPDKSVVSCCFLSQMINDYNRKRYDITIDQNNKNAFAKEYHSIKPDCLMCHNFDICNSCRMYIKEVKDSTEDMNEYCIKMKYYTEKLREVFMRHINEIDYREY